MAETTLHLAEPTGAKFARILLQSLPRSFREAGARGTEQSGEMCEGQVIAISFLPPRTAKAHRIPWNTPVISWVRLGETIFVTILFARDTGMSRLTG